MAINKFKKIKLFTSPVLVILLLSLMFFLEFTSVLNENQTVDEGVHLASGYSYLKTGDYRINPEHPPLIKEISALPLFFLKLKLPIDHDSWRDYNQWEFARQFLYHNTIDADYILLLGRLPMMLLSLILGFFIYKWTNKLMGPKAAVIALLLYAFEPNILAHSRYITNDIGLTLFFYLTIFTLDQYLKTYSKKYLIVLIFVFGLAQIAKFSAVILLPLLILFLILKKVHQPSSPLSLAKISQVVLGLILSSIIFILISYRFEIIKAINDLDVQKFYVNQSKISNLSEFKSENHLVHTLLIATHPTTTSGSFIYQMAQKLPLPAFSYFKGLYKLISHDYWGHLSYLLGNYSNHGFWYYFPVAFLVKTPLTLIILLLIGFSYFLHQIIIRFLSRQGSDNYHVSTNLIKKSRFGKIRTFWQTLINKIVNVYRSIPFTYWLLSLTIMLYFLWTLTSKINIGLRHLFPIYPFLIILSSRLFLLKPKRLNFIWQGFLIISIVFYLFSCFKIYPNFLAYFNEAAGGAKNGPRYLVDSNIDWGQDLLKLKHYLEKSEISEIYFGYFGSLNLDYYQINFKYLPTNNDQEGIKNLDGFAAISVTVLYEEKGRYNWLKNFEPKERIGYSIYLYDLRKNR